MLVAVTRYNCLYQLNLLKVQLVHSRWCVRAIIRFNKLSINKTINVIVSNITGIKMLLEL